MMMSKNNWSVYLLTSGTRTYIGSTVDPPRRLRQHNGEIVGGARATRGRKWELALVITGFANRSEACRWERIVKCRCRGYGNRFSGLFGLLVGDCPKKGSLPPYPVPGGLYRFDTDPLEVRPGIRFPY